MVAWLRCSYCRRHLVLGTLTERTNNVVAGQKNGAGLGRFTERFAKVNGVRLRYLIGGQGSAVMLLHGYAETGHMWRPIMPSLATRHTVIVPDLRGAGGSAKPASGYDKKTMAVDIHELTRSLKFDRVSIVGHDIGLMVAYAYAAQFPQTAERVVLMDAFLPGIGDWTHVWQEGVHQDDPLRGLRELGGVGIRHHQPDVVADDADAIELQRSCQLMDVDRHRLLVVAGRRLGRASGAAQIRHHDGVTRGERRHDRAPHVAGFGVAVTAYTKRRILV